MVCSVGTGRMAVMARLLEAGSFSENVAGYARNQKLVAEYIRKEIFEADEPNLLDEEASSQVCCNACKKPVKASHYAAHADLCVFLRSTRDDGFEPNFDTEHRKPPIQRGKVFPVYANELTQVRKQETWEVMDADDSTASEAYMDGGLSFFSKVAKAGDFPRYTLPQSEEQSRNEVDHTSYGNLHGNNVRYRDIPAPLASKIYYSQRNNRLRSEIAHLFQVAETKELDDTLASEATQQNITEPEVSSQIVSPPGQNSDACLMTAGKQKPADIFLNQPSVNEALRREASSTMAKVTDMPKSSVSNSGTMAETTRQTNGGAPCIDVFAERFY